MSTVIDTLIYDRTQEDVDRVFTLKRKILWEGLGSLSAEERAEYLGGLKGAYNYTDLNRVGEAVRYLAGRFTGLPVELKAYRDEKGVADDPLYELPYDPASVVVEPKTDWTVADIPTQAQAKTYLNNLAVLRRQLVLPADTPAVPATLDRLTFTTANEIEYLLWNINAALVAVENDLYDRIDRTAVGFFYAGEVNCGE